MTSCNISKFSFLLGVGCGLLIKDYTLLIFGVGIGAGMLSETMMNNLSFNYEQIEKIIHKIK